ncbi:tetratricopeptide repeat protein [Polaribacter sp. Q13]|uniref:tetratricopeptide repeat protein n=1 Tax=Polaribacter sp. Q13 TaxID=2806551 RepID=UPI00193BACA5|nr:tetratricopeptide repeat protein [Polaribacter sp. Q13]QVY66585.1 tetratricopeptide repeat protein [Polaribacter sp. Q13]
MNKELYRYFIIIYILYTTSIQVIHSSKHQQQPATKKIDSISVRNSNFDINFYIKKHKEAKKNKNSKREVFYLQKIGNYHYNQMNFTEALNYFSKALFLSEQKGLQKETAENLKQLGSLYCKFGDYEIGETYLHRALLIAKQLQLEEKIAYSKLIPYYQNMVELERHKLNNERALSYLDSCFTITDSLKFSTINKTSLYRIKAGIYMAIGSSDTALKILLPLEIQGNIEDLKNTTENEVGSQILVSSGIARIYMSKKDYTSALSHYLKSLALIEKLNIKNDHQAFVKSKIAEIYKELGDNEKAYTYLLEASEYTDKHLKATSKRNKSVLKIRDSYQEMLENQEKKIAEKESTILRFRIISLLILFIFIASGLFYRNRKQKIKHKTEQRLIKESSKKKERLSLLQLELKNKELTSYALQLMERDDLLDQFVDYLDNTDESKEAKSLMISRKRLITDTWEEFEKRFVSVNKGFYENLKQEFTDLTIIDLKYCALLKLNLKGKEISKLLGVTEKSVHMARYRIRKKLSLNTDTNLIEFLNNIK